MRGGGPGTPPRMPHCLIYARPRVRQHLLAAGVEAALDLACWWVDLEEIEKIEMAKKLKEINENAEQAGDLLGAVEGESPLVTAIKQRLARGDSHHYIIQSDGRQV